MNTFNIVYLKDDIFYLKGEDGLKEINLEDLENYDYQLLLDDNYFFYESIDMPVTSRKKQIAIIRNFLLVNYPEELITHFHYAHIKKMVLIYIVTDKLFQFIEKNKDVFLKANRISTPFIESLHLFDSFYYRIGNIYYQIINNQIVHTNKTDGEVKSGDNIIENINELKGNLNLVKKSGTFAIVKPLKIPVTMVALAYIIFVIGDILRVNAINGYLKKHENVLNEIYRAAGVVDSKDPFGALINKTNSNTNINNRIVLLVFEQISKAADNHTIVDSLNIRRNSIRFDGITKDYSSLENFTAKLKEYTKKSVSILNTKKEEDHISFSLRIG